MAYLETSETMNCVDIVVVSDQGVTDSDCYKTIYIDDLLNEDIPGRIYTGAVGRIQFESETSILN